MSTKTTEWTEADQEAILASCLGNTTLRDLILGIPRERLHAVVQKHTRASYEEDDTVFFTTRVVLQNGQSFLITSTTSTLRGVTTFEADSEKHTINMTVSI